VQGARSALRALLLGSSAVLANGCATPKPVARSAETPTTPPVRPPAVSYDTTPIIRGIVKRVVVCSGHLAPRQTVDVASPGSGRIAEVHVAVGSRVKKGQALARLEPARPVLSPVDGIVLAREIEPGQAVVVGSSAPTLFRLASDLAAMKIDASVDPASVAKLAVGQHATFTVPTYPQAVFTGTVAQVDNTSTGPGASHRVTLDVANGPLRLHPGITASVTIEAGVHAGVLVAPASALRFRARPGKTTVWKIAGAGKPTEVDVRIGISDGTVVEIVDGVREGDRVVTGTVEHPAPAAPGARRERR